MKNSRENQDAPTDSAVPFADSGKIAAFILNDIGQGTSRPTSKSMNTPDHPVSPDVPAAYPFSDTIPEKAIDDVVNHKQYSKKDRNLQNQNIEEVPETNTEALYDQGDQLLKEAFRHRMEACKVNLSKFPFAPQIDLEQLQKLTQSDYSTLITENDSRSTIKGYPSTDPLYKELSGGLFYTIPVQYGPKTSSKKEKELIFPGTSGLDIPKIRNDFPVLQRKVHGDKDLVWLDNGATTQKPQQVIDAVTQYYAEYNSNIHRGAHQLAREATDAYEEARETTKNFLGAREKDEIVFVRGTTEGINLLANSFGQAFIGAGDEIIISELEHHANIVPWQLLAKAKGAKLVIARTDDRGDILLNEYKQLFNKRTKIVSLSQASNAIGTVVPVREMIQIAHHHQVPVAIDGAQSIQHMPVNVLDLDADFFIFSGHKIFAPMGIGAVYGKREWLEQMPPWQGGGAMIKDVTFESTEFNGIPTIFEAGTPNVEAPIGLKSALEYVSRIGMVNIQQYENALTAYALNQLKSVPKLSMIGNPKHRIGVLPFVMEGIDNEAIGKKLDAEGIAVRVGHHCAQPILRKFGYEGVVRPSLAFYNTHEEIDFLVEVLKGISKA